MTIRPPVTGRRSDFAIRKRVVLCAVLALIFPALTIVAQPGLAGPEILREVYAPATWDRSFANVFVNQKDAQSFIARTNFLLTHVELEVFDQPSPDILQLFVAADGGNHPGTVLASTAQQGVQNWSWVPFSFYPWVSLTAGQRYWIVAQDGMPRPKGYEWATNRPGDYAGGEAQWYDPSVGAWTNNTGADFFFKVFGISGPSLSLDLEPALLPVDPGTVVPIDVYFNNSGNEAAKTAQVDLRIDPGLAYQGDDAALEGGVQATPLSWDFSGISVDVHHMTVWVLVSPSGSYYDGESLQARAYLNYTDSAGQRQATLSGLATVTVLVPVIRGQAVPTPAHVAAGDTFNFTVSFFNVGSGRARNLWLNGSVGALLTVVGDDASSAGALILGPSSWEFQNVSAQTYVFNVTVRASVSAVPGDRLPFHLDFAYTDGAGHSLGTLSTDASATVHGPSLVVEAAYFNPSPQPGDAILAALFLNNTGDENASAAWLNVTLPSMTVLLDSTPVTGLVSGNTVAYFLRNLTAAPYAITLRVAVSTDAPPATPLVLQATLEVENRSGAKLRPSSAQATAVVVTPSFALVLASSAVAVRAGDAIDLVLGWNNTGNDAARRIWLNLTLPAKTGLLNASVPWATTNGTSFGWVFDDVGPGPRTFGVTLEASARLATGDPLRAALSLAYERADGLVLGASSVSLPFTAMSPSTPPGLEVLLLWVAVLVALFLLFLLLGYLDLLPHRRSSIDDVFLLHNSGILICHYSTTMRPDVDSDIASGMLMAVRNFVADAFRSKKGNLQELKYGDYRIEMAHGQHAILVVFTRGHHMKGLAARMADVLRAIEAAYGDAIESWSGRTEDLKGVEEHLLRLVAP